METVSQQPATFDACCESWRSRYEKNIFFFKKSFLYFKKEFTFPVLKGK